MADQSKPAAAEGAAAGSAKPKSPARKRGAADDSTQRLADRLAGLGGSGGNAGAAPARPRSARAAAPSSGTRTTAARPPAGRTTANTGKGTKPMTTAAPMPAEQTKPAAFYSARVSHATTPDQLGELEQIRLTENTARRAARRPALSITALLRAATQICLENDRLRAQMIKRAGEEWN